MWFSLSLQDATTFLPEWSDGVKPQGSLGFATLSYSLSMVRPFVRPTRVGALMIMFQIPSCVTNLLMFQQHLMQG